MLLAQRRKLLILFIDSSMNHNFISVFCALLHDAVFLFKITAETILLQVKVTLSFPRRSPPTAYILLPFPARPGTCPAYASCSRGRTGVGVARTAAGCGVRGPQEEAQAPWRQKVHPVRRTEGETPEARQSRTGGFA